MKNLELENYGVLEIENSQKVETVGGFLLGVVIAFTVGAWLVDSVFNYNSTVEHFKKGWDSVN